MKQIQPNYDQIYVDILNKKFPHKKEECKVFLEKPELSTIDILELNKKIFEYPDKETEAFNQKHRSYSKSDIIKILEYQKNNNLNNSELSRHFLIGRNTITKWRKIFIL